MLDSDAVLDRLTGEVMWMALSITDPSIALSEPGAGYERQLVTSSDWAAGMVEKMFGPARTAWMFTHVAMLRAGGDVIYWLPLDGPVNIVVGETYTFALELEVFAA